MIKVTSLRMMGSHCRGSELVRMPHVNFSKIDHQNMSHAVDLESKYQKIDEAGDVSRVVEEKHTPSR